MPRAIGIGIGTAFGGSVPSAFGDATFWLDAASGLVNLGQGGTALTPTSGSSAGADSNDPLLLSHTGTNYLYLPGVSGNYASVPDADALDITGDIDIRVRVAMDDWTPSVFNVIAAKWGSTNATYSWYFAFNADNTLRLQWVDSALNGRNASSTVSIGVADGSLKWVRVTLDVDNGAATPQYEVKFWLSDDNVTYTQLGSTVTGSTGVTNIQATTTALSIGAIAAGTSPSAGKFYRAQIRNGIDGTVVLDADFTTGITSGAQTSFTESSSNAATVTINRSTSGRKAVAVTRPVWLFGTDDYLEVADNDLLDFGASDSFTVMTCGRFWNTQGTDDTLVAKKANTTNTTQGWSLSNGSSTALNGQAQIGDGTAGITATSASRTVGALTMVTMVRNVGSDNVTVYTGSTAGTPVTDTTTTTLANSEVMRIGRLAGAGTEYADMTLVAVAVWRRALSAAEITAAANYYGAA